MVTDGRIPVTILTDASGLKAALAGPGRPALLAGRGRLPPDLPASLPRGEVGVQSPRHFAGCACCTGRPVIAAALDRLFQDRARGRCGWFDRVLVLAPDAETRANLDMALREDALTAARFRRHE